VERLKRMSEQIKRTGRVTIPTNLDVVPETIEILKRWGADAIRDCDGTEFPEELIVNRSVEVFKKHLKKID
jgi:1,3-beta-galactosyl-N-acetylhexosamine phosphorylase